MPCIIVTFLCLPSSRETGRGGQVKVQGSWSAVSARDPEAPNAGGSKGLAAEPPWLYVTKAHSSNIDDPY